MQKHSYISIFICIMLVLPEYLYAAIQVAPYLRQRPTQLSIDQRLPEWYEYLKNHNACGRGRINITPIVTTSFKADLIAQSLFGIHDTQCASVFKITGSQAERSPTDWLADYFGLPTDYESIVQFKPQITNVITDLEVEYNLDCIIHGLYINVHAPFVFTSWNLNFNECVTQPGENAYLPGYFSDTEISRTNLTKTFFDFTTNETSPTIEGVTFMPLERAKFGCKPLKKKEFSLIDLNLGWLVYESKRTDLAFELGITAPLNEKPTGLFIFEPVTGNTGHWQINGTIFNRLLVWESCDECQKVCFYSGLQVAHFFASTQHRTFDLCGKPNSRYMLAQKFTSEVTDNLRGDVNGELVSPEHQGLSIFSPVANLTTIPIDVSIALQVDLAIALTYIFNRTAWMFGYGYWGQTREHITPHFCTELTNNTWALKGDAQIIGFEDSINNPPIRLSATQSRATIERGRSIDNAFPAFADTHGDMTFNELRSQPGGPNQISTSVEPIFICAQNINIESARLNNSAHKLFSNVIYTWHESDHIMPYIGFGANVYFGQTPNCIAPHTRDEKFHAVTISFWSTWIKAGCNF